ncbi:MAG: SpoIID/LytB domain-containing protein [Ignavibacteria bacterium]|nr:MAG: SpoIID/LytB domain-containing protein [Ignavibacteria bacterium]
MYLTIFFYGLIMKKLFFIIYFFSVQLFFSQIVFQKEPIVRVRIINTVDTLRLLFNDKWLPSNGDSLIFSPADGEVMFTIEAGKIKIYKSGSSINLESEEFALRSIDERGTLIIKNVPFGVGWWWESKEDRTYEGEFHFYITKENKFEIVIHLPLEEYLKGVVPYEIGGDSPLEAIKAQAVAARSEAIMALTSKLYSGEHHDLTSDVECQVFSGNKKRTGISDRAVEETKSLILSENGKPINAYYASNCGGHSELIKNVWGDRPGVESYGFSHFDSKDSASIDLSNDSILREWLFSNPKSYCNPNIHSELPTWSQNNFRWKVGLTTEAISEMTAKGKDLGNLVDIKILKRGESGRAYLAKFIFEKDSVEVKSELKIRQMISPPLRSACLVVDKTDSGFVFYGAGWGHGVGMCQSGAITMARNGKTFEEILKHYYRKANTIMMK